MYKSIFIVIVSIFLFVTGCGSPGSHNSSGTGAVAFSVAWQGTPTVAPAVNGNPGAQDPTLLASGPLDCGASGVSTVSAFAYSSSNELLASGGPWNCSDHSGTINNIPAQSNVKIVIFARDASGSGLYRGEQPGITITAGQITDAGTLVASLFVPTLTAPANGSSVINESLSWTSTGVSYEIQVSHDNGFTSTMIDATQTATVYTAATAWPSGTYYWRVRSIDNYGNASAWSPIWVFVVIAQKSITMFSFTNPAATGAIDENAKTIAVTVPYGTNVTALVATFTTTGASVKVGSIVQVSGVTPNDFTNPVSYVVTAADGTTATYTVTVTIALNPAKAITAYSLLGIAGTINEPAKTISLTVLSGTDVTALVATFSTTGVNVKVGTLTQVSGITPNDFTNPVAYIVTAADGTTATYTVTVTVVPLPIYPTVSAGGSNTLWLKSDGTVWAWGDNSAGQLGDGTTTTRTRPVQVYNLTNVAAISSGGGVSLALKTDGTVWAWGYNAYGALGDGTTTNRTTPVKVSGLTAVIAISAGGPSVALKGDGTVWAWGYNGYGAVGDGTTINRTTPVRVSGLTGVTAISAGGDHTIALRSGKVWAWGSNTYGQLGDGTTTNRTTPVQVSLFYAIDGGISAGFEYNVAFHIPNSLFVWGFNNYGQLGDGTTTTQTTPVYSVMVSPSSTIFSAGFMHTLAVNSSGTAFAWGYNGYGQLGDGTTTIRTTPVQVSGMTGVTAISAGQFHSVALKSDGTVWTWGNNAYGQLGDGTTTNRTTPVQVQ